MTFSKTRAELARARAAAATQAHHATGNPSEHFDWDAAIARFQAMIEQLESKRA